METVLITGTTRGIGLELTKQFLELGYHVISTYRGQPSNQLSELRSHKMLTLMELDVNDDTSIAKLAQDLSGITIDILINNAGVFGPNQQSLETINIPDWLNTFAINTIAPLIISRALLQQLKMSSNPRIMTISSQMGALNLKGTGMYAYRSSKSAVNKTMQILALEIKDQGIIVCLMHPGWVRTNMGGKTADISVEESASGIIHVVRHLTLEQTGMFFTWQGNEHAW